MRDMLHTDRRTKREERKAHVNKKTWSLHASKHLVMKREAQQSDYTLHTEQA